VRSLLERPNCSAIDIENEAEIWAEEIESDYDYEFEDGYEGSLLDLDVQFVQGESIVLAKSL
jgi:hypothetical protein